MVQIGIHLRFGIICGPVWGSFPVGDHSTVFFYRFQTIFQRIEINKRNQNIPKPRRCKVMDNSRSFRLMLLSPKSKVRSEHKIARPRAKKLDPAPRLTCSSHVLSLLLITLPVYCGPWHASEKIKRFTDFFLRITKFRKTNSRKPQIKIRNVDFFSL